MTNQHLAERPVQPRPGVRSSWRLATGLLLLSAIPISAGTLRILQLVGGPEITPADSRFDALPLALVLHIIGSAVFALLGILQFLPRFRSKHRTWHRRSGRVMVVTGTVVTGSALWLTLFYDPQPGSGHLLYVFRLMVVTAMTASIVLGFRAIRRRNIRAHRAWMMRAYAIGLGAGTQIFTEGFGQALFGEGILAGDLEKGAGWAINLLIAEWAIRRAPRRRKR